MKMTVKMSRRESDDSSKTIYAWSPSPSSSTLTLPEQIAERIGNQIIRGLHEPGARIHEQDVANQFSVSRGPVREALRILERDGLVKISARRGAQVTKLTAKEVRDLFEVRISLIGLAARLAAERGDAEFILEMREGLQRLAKIAKEGDADAYTNAVYRQNLVFAEGSENQFVRDLVFALAHQTLRYARLGLSTQSRRTQSVRNWKVLVTALEQKQPQAAQEAAERLVRESRDMAVKLLLEMETADGTGNSTGD